MTKITADKVTTLIDMLGTVGKNKGDRGITRLAYTELETQAHHAVRHYMRGSEFNSMEDAAGNTLIGDIDNPAVLIGSHLDTVPNGGEYDGAAGIVAGMLILEELKALQKEEGVCLAIFRGEESSRFGKAMLGSYAFCFGLNYGTMRDATDGKMTLKEAIKSCGYNPEQTVHANPLGQKVKAYFELHTEQADVLSKHKCIMGIVDLIAAAERYEFVLTGKADHSGTTPITNRSDAIYVQSQITDIVRRLSWRYRSSPGSVIGTVVDVQTMGAFMNKICGYAAMKIDIRSAYKDKRKEFVDELFDRAKKACNANKVAFSHIVIDKKDPVEMDSALQDMLNDALTAARYSKKIMPIESKAGHDAVNLAIKGIPSAMILVQSKNGSHNPDEYADPEHLALSTRVLAEAVLNARDCYRP